MRITTNFTQLSFLFILAFAAPALAADPAESTPGSDADPRPLKSVMKLSQKTADTARPGEASGAATTTKTADAKPASAPGWLGRVVFVKDNAKAMIKDRSIDLKTVPFPARVQRVNGEWLWVERAWVVNTDTMNSDDALIYYNQLISKDPSVGAYVHRGAVLAAKGDLDKAIADFDEAIKQDPNNATAHAERGIAWAEKGHLNKAVSGFNDALQIDPKNIEANNNLAWLRATNPDEKVRDGKQAVTLALAAYEATNHKEWGTCDTLAAAYAEQGKFSDAIVLGERAFEMATLPDDKKIAREHVAQYRANKPIRDVKK